MKLVREAKQVETNAKERLGQVSVGYVETPQHVAQISTGTQPSADPHYCKQLRSVQAAGETCKTSNVINEKGDEEHGL